MVVSSASLGVFLGAANPLIAAIDVSESTGAAQTSVPIQVPGFRGLEPNLALVYHSGGGNGIAGVGWSLVGFPHIERQGADGGSPQYDSSDSYNLGGEDLHPCGVSSSPGCLAGGTHYTEHENYQRIAYDSGADQWLVESRNGTKSVYTPLLVATGGTFRWKLASVTDILGNAVNYNWWCDTGKDCFPDNVTYNGYRVKLYYDSTRTDKITYATGASIAEIRQRLRSIKVELTSGAAIRAYKLLYPLTSNSTGRSLLGSVQMYGKDVVIDGSGNITAGTTLPPETYTYSTDVSDHSFTGGGSWSAGCAYTLGTGDFNGDGRQDFYCHYGSGTGALDVGISTGTGFNKTSWGQACAGTGKVMSTGDFNGDGKTDFLCKLSNSALDVGLSSGSGLSWSQWSASWCTAPTAGDFDGDGKTDLACHTPDVKVRLSTGSSFAAQTTWISNWCRPNGGTSWGEQWGVSAKALYPADYDGDGNTDLLCRSTSGSPGGHWVARSNGSNAFVHEGKWLTELWCGGNDQYSLGDFNGDGKTDYACYDNAALGKTLTTKVAFSDGSKFQDKGQWLGAIDCQRLSFGDMNGDGRTDVWCHENGTWALKVGLSNGASGFSDWATWKSNWCTVNKAMAGDFNGDGKTDISCRTSTSMPIAPSGGLVGKTDVLTSVQNSSGGTTNIAYVPGTQWTSLQTAPPGQNSSDDNQGGQVSFLSTHPMTPGSPTVSSITILDGRGWSKTTTYQYVNGKYDPEHRVWLGFEFANRWDPPLPGESSGPYTQTHFEQNRAAVGAVWLSRRFSVDKILSSVQNNLSLNGDGETEPFTATVFSRSSENYDGTTGIPCTSWPCANGEQYYQEFDYDEYGNLIETRDHGNYHASGDETTTVGDFFPNLTDYVVDKIGRSVTYAGIGTAGAKLTEVRFFYDHEITNYTLPPLDGLLTNRQSWLNVGNRYIPMCLSGDCIQYDLYGNVTQVTNIKGAVTQLTYDTTYHLFPETVTNALNHVTQTQWDAKCQAPTSVTDPNLQVTTTTYDPLCRHDRTDGPLGAFADMSYVSIGTPASQYTQVDTPSPTGTGNHWSRSYFDGLGRTYRSESRGATAGQDIQSGEVTFNARGAVATAAAPRFTGATQYPTNFTYDVRDRRWVTTLPDGVLGETLVYGLREVSRYDAENDRITTSRSVNGLTTYLDEYLGAIPVRTTTVKNLTNRTETRTDHVGNTWTKQFDSLGRITWVSDPDSGTETREYNDAGELTAATNLLPERTEFTYDLLSRLATKTTRAGTPSAQTTTFVYDEARSGYFNKGRQTSMLDAAGYQYDDYDRLGRPARTQRSIDGQVYVFSHAYNAAGLRLSTTFPAPDSQVISWTYDAAGNLKTETGTITDSTYDAARRVLTRNFTNGVVTTNTYSLQRGWINTIDTVKNSTVHQDLTYQHYSDGTIQSIASAKSMESWTYTYDDLNRLLGATNADTPSLTQSFVYNEIGNITSNSQMGTYSYPTPGAARPHAVTSAGTRSYCYNAIGQMTSRNGTPTQCNGTQIVWNGDGKPSSIGNVAFTYDGLGSRLKKTSGGQTTRYIGGDYEIAPDGTVTKYLNGGKQVGMSFFIHHRDHLGSIQVVTNSAGTEVRRQKHKPFGDQHYVSGSHLESKGWIGEREEETELVYLNARYYDPELGRFTAPDALVKPGQGMNRYAYALNNPVNLVDPSGLCPERKAEGGCYQDPPPGMIAQLGRIAARQSWREGHVIEISDDPRINRAYRHLVAIAARPGLSEETRVLLGNAIAALNAPGVTVSFSDTVRGQVPNAYGSATYEGPLIDPITGTAVTTHAGDGGANVTILILTGTTGDKLVEALAHEGTHAFQYQQYAQDLIEASRAGDATDAHGGATDLTLYDRENQAYHASAVTAIALGASSPWVENNRVNQGAIDDHLRSNYGVTPTSPGDRISPLPSGYLPWGPT
jgi:RHS repeat-associated protein